MNQLESKFYLSPQSKQTGFSNSHLSSYPKGQSSVRLSSEMSFTDNDSSGFSDCLGSVNPSSPQIEIFHERTKALENFENYFIGWIRRNNFNFDKIQKITALIYLNMSPLHEERLGDLLRGLPHGLQFCK